MEPHPLFTSYIKACLVAKRAKEAEPSGGDLDETPKPRIGEPVCACPADDKTGQPRPARRRQKTGNPSPQPTRPRRKTTRTKEPGATA
jgi:hypothetical protein